jgi:sulfatase maturation enzyme AslB (radical SAM superfamily)
VSGLFQSVVSSLKIIRELACTADNVSIHLSAVLTRWNVNSLKELLNFAKAERLQIVLSLPMDTSSYYRTDRLENEYSLLPTQKQQLCRELKRLLFASRVMQSLDDLTERHLIHLIDHLNGKPRNEPCVFRSRTGCFVTSLGEVFACGGGEEFRLGHLDSEPLSAILAHPKSRNSPLQSIICDRCPSICYLQAGE